MKKRAGGKLCYILKRGATDIERGLENGRTPVNAAQGNKNEDTDPSEVNKTVYGWG